MQAHDAAPRAAMSESCAVPLYLAGLLGEQGKLALQTSEEEHPSFLQWLFHADATLTFPQAVVMRYGLFEQGRADAAADDYGRVSRCCLPVGH